MKLKGVFIRPAAAALSVCMIQAPAMAGADDVSLRINDTTVTFNLRYPVLDGGWELYVPEGTDLFGRKRIEEVSFAERAPYCILNRRSIFMPVTIDAYAALSYADIVNRISEAVPGTNVYSMIVPDAYELYAPEKYSTGQLEMIEYIYRQLKDAVPVDITRALTAHSEEKIYFDTDHHWTHRGAYYAWEYFAELKGMSIAPLSGFENRSAYFTGSFAGALSAEEREALLDSDTELLERFMPVYETEACAYSDMYLNGRLYSINVVDPNEDSYMCFIGGDNPLTVIKSSVANGKSIAVIKESVGNLLVTWAVNNYENIYAIDVRGFKGGSFDIGAFCANYDIDDLLIESYPESIAAADLRGYLEGLI